MRKIYYTWPELVSASLADLMKKSESGSAEAHARAHTAYEHFKAAAMSGEPCLYVKHQE